MNATLEAPPIIKAGAVRTFTENARAGVRRVVRLLIFVWKYSVGMLLCQSLIGAVVVVGWTYRLMQRMAWRRWWERSDLRRNGGHFQPFVESDETTAGQVRWPNWLMQPTVATGLQSRGVRRLVASLWANVRTGVQAIFNTWVLTLPGCLLMAFSWYDGWNNSFNKGYEQAIVGPLTGVTGLLLFLLAMFYVPLAQARQAVTGEWTSFYDFRLVGRLIVRRWPACLGLAILYSLASVPVQMLRVLPEFFPQFGEQSPAYVATLPAATITDDLNSYFFWSAAYLFPAFVVLRIIAARIYATGLLGAVEAGIISPDALRVRERAVLGA